MVNAHQESRSVEELAPKDFFLLPFFGAAPDGRFALAFCGFPRLPGLGVLPPAGRRARPPFPPFIVRLH